MYMCMYFMYVYHKTKDWWWLSGEDVMSDIPYNTVDKVLTEFISSVRWNPLQLCSVRECDCAELCHTCVFLDCTESGAHSSVVSSPRLRPIFLPARHHHWSADSSAVFILDRYEVLQRHELPGDVYIQEMCSYMYHPVHRLARYFCLYTIQWCI